MSVSLVQGASLASSYSLPVLVVPIGDVHPSVLREYLAALDKYTVLPLDNLTPPGDYSRDRSGFPHLSWCVEMCSEGEAGGCSCLRVTFLLWVCVSNLVCVRVRLGALV